jgi:metal-sulfur cluster biosynthetic enzyme
MAKVSEDDIRTALDLVCDPCSIAAQAPLSIVDMGLVRGWTIDEELNLVVTMCVTSPSCTMGPHMVRAAEEALSKIAGVKSARVDMDPGFFWSPESMTSKGLSSLARRRQESVARRPVVPQQWRQSRQEG